MCVQLDVKVSLHMLSQEGGMVSSVEESVEINCAVFLILIEVESAWKSEEAVFILSCLQRSIEKASQKTLSTLKILKN